MYILQGGVRWYANCGFAGREPAAVTPQNIYKTVSGKLNK